MSQCLSIGNPVLVCVCAGGGPVSGSFSTLLPSAFLILVELRPTPPQSYNTAKNLCMCQGEGSSPSLWGSDACTVVCALSCLSVVREEGQDSRPARVWETLMGLILGPSENSSPFPLLSGEAGACPEPGGSLLLSPKFCLHWWGRRSLGFGITELVKRTWATRAKVGTFEAGWGVTPLLLSLD